MTQKEQVVIAFEQNGGYATFTELYRTVDTVNWGTKTPAASIRRIVQQNADLFYRIMPGQWGLVSKKKQIEQNGATARSGEYTHGYFQGLLVDIGNVQHFETYIPPQDKNRLCSHRKLGDMATLATIYDFANQRIMRRAKTVDTIWFNGREMPNSFFEVEHTTDIRNSLDKFFELQDFNAKFYIVSSKMNTQRFNDLMKWSRYAEIVGLVKFYDYDRLVKLHELKMTEADVMM